MRRDQAGSEVAMRDWLGGSERIHFPLWLSFVPCPPLLFSGHLLATARICGNLGVLRSKMCTIGHVAPTSRLGIGKLEKKKQLDCLVLGEGDTGPARNVRRARVSDPLVSSRHGYGILTYRDRAESCVSLLPSICVQSLHIFQKLGFVIMA
jgi:hypothetical protein